MKYDQSRSDVVCKFRPDEATDLDEGGPTAGEAAEAERKVENADTSIFLRGDGESSGAYARRIFERVFCQDILQLASVEVRLDMMCDLVDLCE